MGFRTPRSVSTWRRRSSPRKPRCWRFVAKKVQEWIEGRGIGAVFIEPGSPWQNGHNESFNAVFRDGCLNRWLFESIREARETTEAWLQEYNQVRPHGSLGGLAPFMFFKHGKPQDREAA